MGHLEVTQDVSLGHNDVYFRTRVTIRNKGRTTLQDVRYGRSCDPDNTQDMGGHYATTNQIESTLASGDSFASVSATSKKNDPYYKRAGSSAQLTYVSSDPRAIAALGKSGLHPTQGVYTSEVNTPQRKGTSAHRDAWIGMFFKLGNMAPGASTTFTFDTYMATKKVTQKKIKKLKTKLAKTGASGAAAGLASCKNKCRATAGCNVAKWNPATRECCLSAIDTAKKCPGKWVTKAGWTGHSVCA